ncbi:nuclear transport factor 2 family protein [Algibacter sp. PT7-4]|uniref:nuclear transport factor 2 family protein n=1 Tax=Algibacter ulvanivorans TaxID=3400999 RepID=UPI003AAB282F
MKKIILLIFISVFVFNCNKTQRYTQNSAEIDAVKTLIKAYNNKDYATAITHYSDTSKTRFNKAFMNSKDVAKYHQQNDVNYSKRAFLDEGQIYEMVVDDEGKTWVNFWGNWKATLKGNNKDVVIFVHLTSRFVNGKIVEEYGYWDPSEVIANLQEIAAAKTEQTTED